MHGMELFDIVVTVYDGCNVVRDDDERECDTGHRFQTCLARRDCGKLRVRSITAMCCRGEP